jgi:(R,R)-butanediol dehydrogenase/meso-butanediol dehydrogenase/diacetyl reductase
VKAAIWHGPMDIRIGDVPEPSPAPGEVKIRVAWCGMSGTDVHEYESGPILIPTEPHPLTGQSAPVVMGHEFAGVVAEVGAGVTGFAVGDPVTANSLIHCGICRFCVRGQQNRCSSLAILGLSADGAFADYVCVPATIAYKLPEDFPLEWGALLEPMSTGVRALRRGRLAAGERVVVIGGGPIGMGVVQAALALGAADVILVEPVEQRRALGQRFGARALDAADDVRAALADTPADLTLDCVALPSTLRLAIDLLGPGGRTVLVGVAIEPGQIDVTDIMLHEKELIGTAGRLHREDFPALVALIGRGAIDAAAMVTRHIALDDVVALGFEAMRTDRERHLKILVELGR